MFIKQEYDEYWKAYIKASLTKRGPVQDSLFCRFDFWPSLLFGNWVKEQRKLILEKVNSSDSTLNNIASLVEALSLPFNNESSLSLWSFKIDFMPFYTYEITKPVEGTGGPIAVMILRLALSFLAYNFGLRHLPTRLMQLLITLQL
jgi:hypothetical protein